jgi:ATP-dependent DNA helicase DinG
VLSTPVLVQGDKPPAALLEEFEDVEESTLCATMGFWQGVNVLGPSLTLVTMNKLPFAPFNEPLLSARLEAASSEGRNGFTEIYVADTATKVAQGFGRLIRSATDKGVVAILDTRLRTKGYGPLIIRTLPEAGIFSDRDVVLSALKRLTSNKAA